ncbi:PP2C family protein-serine/threonine phosphatase [Jidongwangia harbinensis]|uniref:PP2C family protein-serine/threonine phosphatase n=1 Tax=Jidongwangia harbinensis TaxID=2878561 RepID=UPI001CDA3EEC|nr:PP2C family protein-serine/threonine phosphatase [Jidongwangia harbinensis]MCA2219091.1 serine/threonine-protein phosphatase [Jidongwangia harbinensis]
MNSAPVTRYRTGDPDVAGDAETPPAAPDFLLAAYRMLGQSLSLQRNAHAAVWLPVPVLADAVALILTTGPGQAQWWMTDGGTAVDDPDRIPVRWADTAPADLPDWIRTALADAEGPWVRPVDSGPWVMPDGTKRDGHGVAVRLLTDHLFPGVLLLFREADRPVFDAADHSLAARYAEPVSRAVTAARLYRDQAQVADTLRAALRPTPLPSVAGLDMAMVYRPAREAMQISGDIVHVEPMPDGGALCAVGDVCGKGVDAAMAGGRLRLSLGVLRRITGQPLDILAVLNEASFDACGVAATQFTTAVVGSVRRAPEGGALLRLAAGGHLPPLVIRRTGAVEAVHVGGMMLGADLPGQFTEVVVWLAPGETCVIYTDGVTEARGPAGAAFGQERLAALLADYAGVPAAVLAERIEQCLVDWLTGADHDDIALLVLRAQPATASCGPA